MNIFHFFRPKNYVLLSDVLSRITLSEEELRENIPDIRIISVDTRFVLQEVERSQISQPLPDSCCKKPWINLVELEKPVKRLLNISVESLSELSRISHNQESEKGNSYVQNLLEIPNEVVDPDSSMMILEGVDEGYPDEEYVESLETISYGESPTKIQQDEHIADKSMIHRQQNTVEKETNYGEESQTEDSPSKVGHIYDRPVVTLPTPEDSPVIYQDSAKTVCQVMPVRHKSSSGQEYSWPPPDGTSCRVTCQSVSSNQNHPREGTTPEQCLTFTNETPFTSPELHVPAEHPSILSPELLKSTGSPCRLKIVEVRTLDSPSSRSVFAPEYATSPPQVGTVVSPGVATDGQQ